MIEFHPLGDMGAAMASLWRVLALSWLGGVASPIMLDDTAIADAYAPAAAVITRPAGELPALDEPWTESLSDERNPLLPDSLADR